MVKSGRYRCRLANDSGAAAQNEEDYAIDADLTGQFRHSTSAQCRLSTHVVSVSGVHMSDPRKATEIQATLRVAGYRSRDAALLRSIGSADFSGNQWSRVLRCGWSNCRHCGELLRHCEVNLKFAGCHQTRPICRNGDDGDGYAAQRRLHTHDLAGG